MCRYCREAAELTFRVAEADWVSGPGHQEHESPVASHPAASIWSGSVSFAPAKKADAVTINNMLASSVQIQGQHLLR